MQDTSLETLAEIEEFKTHLRSKLETARSVGIFLSGGLDSAVVLFMLLHLIREYALNCTVTAYTVDRVDGSTKHAKNIVAQLEHQFAQSIKHVIFVPKTTSGIEKEELVEGLRAVTEDTSLDYIVLCGNLPPPFEVHPTIPNIVRYVSTRPRELQPLITKTKKFTLALAKHYNLVDLMLLSHTCTETTGDRCGQCWWCAERAWAFKVNDYVDPGRL